MLSMWDAVEADFQRDYGIDLTRQLDSMSWRRFKVLVSNLNPYGAVASRVQMIHEHGSDEVDDEADKAAADAFFRDIVAI